jgi:hypothetical protein
VARTIIKQGGILMKNWKTTVSGILSALGVIFPAVGLPAEIGQAVTVIGLALLSYFAKDKDVTGTN